MCILICGTTDDQREDEKPCQCFAVTASFATSDAFSLVILQSSSQLIRGELQAVSRVCLQQILGSPQQLIRGSVAPGQPPAGRPANSRFPPEAEMSCEIVPAKDLGIIWKDDPNYWVSKPNNAANARFPRQVVELVKVCWLEIHGQIDSSLLSKRKEYEVYLIYKLAPNVQGLKQPYFQKATIEFNGKRTEADINLDSETLEPYAGEKGWSEIKLGSFQNTGSGCVHAMLLGSEGLRWKIGLTVAGMEFREVNRVHRERDRTPTGRNVITQTAAELYIAWGGDPNYWDWKHDIRDSRFRKVAKLLEVCWLEIKGQLNSDSHLDNKEYEVYLIYKLHSNVRGLRQPYYQKASIEFNGRKTVTNINLDSEHLELYRGEKGWNQIKLGKFMYTGSGTVEAKLLASEGLYWKSGLTVAGMEWRQVNRPGHSYRRTHLVRRCCTARCCADASAVDS